MPEAKLVDIRIEYCGSKLDCPECKKRCPQADMAPERTWRHLNTMQFTTLIHAAVPRSKCSTCGVLTIPVPWAGKHSRFTLLFEYMAVEVIKVCSGILAASKLLGMDWQATQSIMDRAVERGLKRRNLDNVRSSAMRLDLGELTALIGPTQACFPKRISSRPILANPGELGRVCVWKIVANGLFYASHHRLSRR